MQKDKMRELSKNDNVICSEMIIMMKMPHALLTGDKYIGKRGIVSSHLLGVDIDARCLKPIFNANLDPEKVTIKKLIEIGPKYCPRTNIYGSRTPKRSEMKFIILASNFKFDDADVFKFLFT